MLGNGVDTFAGQGMGAEIRVASGRDQKLLPRQLAQEFEHAFGRLTGPVEIFERRLIGRAFMRAGIGEERAQGGLLPTGRDRSAGAPTAGDGGAETEQHGEEGRTARRRHGFPAPRQMAAGDMADFVGDNPDHLPGFLGRHEKPGMKEKVLAPGDERVEGVVIDQKYAHGGGIEPRDLQQWLRVHSDGIFGLRIANERHSLCGRVPRTDDGGRRYRQYDDERKKSRAQSFAPLAVQ